MENDVSSGGSISSSGNSLALSKQKKPFQGIRVQNPFTFKVGQVFTGFGIGCGLGIGVGRPINLGTFSLRLFKLFRGLGRIMDFRGVFKSIGAKKQCTFFLFVRVLFVCARARARLRF